MARSRVGRSTTKGRDLKKLVTAIAMTLAAMMLAPAASAKEPGEASITGPGLSAPVRIPVDFQGSNETFVRILDWSGYLDAKLPKRPAGRLGPRYELTVSWGLDRIRPIMAHTMVLYPYAEGQPKTFTPEQAADGDRARPGWHVAPPELRTLLVDLGLPRSAPRILGVLPASPLGRRLPVAWAIPRGLLSAMMLA